VAVKSTFGEFASAVLIFFAILFDGLYTFLSLWASSMTTKSHGTIITSSSLFAAKFNEQITQLQPGAG